jgi:hypothetical protein
MPHFPCSWFHAQETDQNLNNSYQHGLKACKWIICSEFSGKLP